MAKVWQEIPEVVTVCFRQEKTDKDYGSCLWARFNFDTKNYSMSIESDCGSYQHSWYPTPASETFLHLCSRFDYEYLLYKISDTTVVDADKTFENVKELVTDVVDDSLLDLDELDWDEIEAACGGSIRNGEATFCIISEALQECGMLKHIDTYDLAGCIEKDYPEDAKKIVEVFRDYIQPELRWLSGYKPQKEEQADG